MVLRSRQCARLANLPGQGLKHIHAGLNVIQHPIIRPSFMFLNTLFTLKNTLERTHEFRHSY